ncbi:UDP-N-acetylmuramate dehydrogenase [Actinotignum urinale]|uniref:UDP-N-acetylmuramate dehydrogenase n=1 Tax=Actinotignum urinale TaxID=190146 RepID=UPI0003B77AA4|nr:UDP-N-acetylmuramate dehydrogenase [Actinotignum urinale]MDY5159812.1 UDP-N-acetylmuramate dehydrogenase [Actinotignum urinale]
MSCDIYFPTQSENPCEPVLSHRQKTNPSTLADLTTIGVGGKMGNYIQAESEEEIISHIRQADDAHIPFLMIGGGSNILPQDADFPGIVVRDTREDINVIEVSGCGGATFTATAGTSWDTLVARAVTEDWAGLEALSGIPGTVGAAPVQNIGAYGQEVASSIASVRVYDRAEKKTRSLSLSALKLGYRTSIIKDSIASFGPSPRYIVLSVEFQTFLSNRSNPIAYGQLADTLGVNIGDRIDNRRVREAVLELRTSKGMVINDDDRDSFSCGSFFTNPIISVEQAKTLPEKAPRYAVHDTTKYTLNRGAPTIEGIVKTSAAWLIQNAGFERGYGHGEARLSSKHTLSITNRGHATGADIRALAREIQEGVRTVYGIDLHSEPVIIGGL